MTVLGIPKSSTCLERVSNDQKLIWMLGTPPHPPSQIPTSRRICRTIRQTTLPARRCRSPTHRQSPSSHPSRPEGDSTRLPYPLHHTTITGNGRPRSLIASPHRPQYQRVPDLGPLQVSPTIAYHLTLKCMPRPMLTNHHCMTNCPVCLRTGLVT